MSFADLALVQPTDQKETSMSYIWAESGSYSHPQDKTSLHVVQDVPTRLSLAHALGFQHLGGAQASVFCLAMVKFQQSALEITVFSA